MSTPPPNDETVARSMPALAPAGNHTVASLLVMRAETMPEHPAFELWDDEPAILTYRELLARSIGAAHWLEEHGVERGDRVAVVAETSLAMAVAFYACGLRGAIVMPINPLWTADEIVGALRRTEPTVTLTGIAVDLGAWSGAVHGLDEIERDESGDVVAIGRAMCEGIGPRDPYEILLTSGTTAVPKGVVVSHHNCIGGAVQAGLSIGWGTGERFGSALPLFHANAQSFTLWSALAWGGTAVFFPRFSASAYSGQLDRSLATVTSVVSTQVRTMLHQIDTVTRPRALRHVIFAINVTTEERDELESRWKVPLRNGYGLSEAMTMVAIEPAWTPTRLWPSVGLPAVGRRLRVVDEDGHDVADGEIGELLVAGERGIDLMLGYWQDDAATETALAGGWLHTGDLVRLGALGEVHYVGRRKDVIKVAGENVSAAEVEEAFLSHPAVLECAAVSLPDPIRDERVAVALVLRAPASTDELAEHAAGRLAPFKRPAVVQVMDALPRTSIGKVDKPRIRGELSNQEA